MLKHGLDMVSISKIKKVEGIWMPLRGEISVILLCYQTNLLLENNKPIKNAIRNLVEKSYLLNR